jgi:AcrR family transcriptional regulator
MALREAEQRPTETRNAIRGRPREYGLDERILAAGFEELARGGISHFSVSAVARRAGVAKGTIYLRWPTREQLILDSSALILTDLHPPRPGTIADQLLELAEQWTAVFSQPRAVELLLRIDADRDAHPALFQEIFQQVQGAGNRILEETIRAAHKRGELNPAVDATLLTRMFVGALFVEALAHTPAGQITEGFRVQVVEMILRGAAPASATDRGLRLGVA